MMRMLKTPRANRAAALALLVFVVLAVIAALAVPAYLAHEHYDASNAKMSRLLGAYATLNQSRPRLLRSVEMLRAKDSKKFYLKGATPALASAELQDIAKSSIENNGGRILSTQAMANKDDGGYRQITATIQMSMTNQNLRRVLYALETREPYLFVDGLIVRAQVPPGFKPAPGVEPDLFVQFEVAGYSPIVPTSATPTINNNAQPPSSPSPPPTAATKSVSKI